jgi:hypothetical protein
MARLRSPPVPQRPHPNTSRPHDRLTASTSDDTAMPALDDSPTSPLSIDSASWRTAPSLLTEREGSVLNLRHGAFGGERPTFGAIGV